MICRICREEFTPAKNHPGFINVCLEEECRANAREPQVTRITEESDIAFLLDKKNHRIRHAGQDEGDWQSYANVVDGAWK